MAKRKVSNKDIEQAAVGIVKDEKLRWELATAFVTNKVAFKMRPLIRTLRKNYYGIFDTPTDKSTGQDKVWYPLTEINVEAVIKNIDLDTKDVNFISKDPDSVGITDIVRASVRDKLHKMNFGQALDDLERQLAIDGTVVWKTWEQDGELKRRTVDLLNVYIDPTTPTIQEAYRFTERCLMFPEEVKAMDGWMNTDGIEVNVPEAIPRTDPFFIGQSGQMASNVKMIDVWELWGKFPKSLITGQVADGDQEVEGHIVVSGLDAPGRERVHLIEENPKGFKPYEEAWYTRVPNRWYGKGIAEKLMSLQIYANIIFNVRINRSRMSQLGLFKMRKGAGITPQMLSNLPSNGVVVVNNMDDLEQMVIQEVGATSYKDEDTINSISERLTNAFEVVTGEALPSSTPATNAAIQNTNARSGFTIIKEGIGMFIQRWVDRHALPIWAKDMAKDAVVHMATDEEEFKQILDKVVSYYAAEALEVHYNAGHVPDPMQLQQAIFDAQQEVLQRRGLFVKLVEKIIADGLCTTVQVTNEEMDVAVTIQNILAMLQAAPEYRTDMVKQAFDLMGLQQPRAQQPQMPQQGMPGMMGPQMQPQGGPIAAQQLQALTTNAQTL